MMSSGKPKHSRVGARGMFSLGCAKALGSIPRLTQGKKSRVSILTLSVYSQVGPHFSQGVSKMWRFFCISMPYREEHTFSTQFSEIPFSLELYAPVERLKESSVQQKRLEGEWGTPSTSCNKTVCWGHHVQVQSSLLGCSFLSLFVVSSQMSLHSACAPPPLLSLKWACVSLWVNFFFKVWTEFFVFALTPTSSLSENLHLLGHQFSSPKLQIIPLSHIRVWHGGSSHFWASPYPPTLGIE